MSASEQSDSDGEGTLPFSRREILGGAAGTAGAVGLGYLGYRRFDSDGDTPARDDDDDEPEEIINPLAEYPNRDWESTYRDIWEVDNQYMLTCTPNDTHNCYLEASVKNGTITRLGPSMNYGEATDIYGNQASKRWDPRVCQKGLAMVERFYGERRVKAPMVREGFK